MKSRTFAVVGLTMLLAIVLAGASVGMAQRPTVTVVLFDYDPGVRSWARETMEAFAKEHPEINLVIEPVAPNLMRDKLIVSASAGDPPDVAGIATAWVPEFVASGMLASWEDHLPRSVLDRFNQELLAGGLYRGSQYAIPYLATSRALFYNKDAFNRAGVSVPDTWDEYMEALKAIKARTDLHPLAMQGTGNEAFAAWFLYFYWSFGGELYDGQGRLQVNGPEGVGALQYMRDLVRTNQLTAPNVTSIDVPEQMQLFISGRAATTITGPWMVGMIEGQNPNLNYGVAPLPKGSRRVTLGVTDAYVLFKDSRNKEAVATVMDYLFRPENSLKFVTGRGMLPVLTANMDDPAFAKEPINTFVRLFEDVRFVQLCSNWTRIMDEGTRALQSVYLGRSEPKPALDRVASAVPTCE